MTTDEWTFRIIEWVIKAVINAFVLMTGFAYMTYAERKVSALLQTRHGPNRVGPFGFFQPLADGLKLFFKEELIPGGADKLIFILAPIITVVPALVILAVVPWGPTVTIACCQVSIPALNFSIGTQYFSREVAL